MIVVGIALKGLGKLEAALAGHTMAVQIKPDFLEGYVQQGSIMAALGDTKGAILAYQTVVKLDPKHHVATQFVVELLQSMKRSGRV